MLRCQDSWSNDSTAPSGCPEAAADHPPERSTRNIKSMTTRIAHFRAQGYVAQRALCYYCRCKMCISDPAKFARSHGISVRQVRQVQCTAEHLTSRRDGGTDTRSNIAAACWHCNKLRHARKTPLAADRYRDYVLRRVSRGTWHDRFLLKSLCQSAHSSQ